MKTLAQVEPRIIVNAANTVGDASNLFIISQPGSYYLTTNITGAAGKNGIRIAASGVTLDLMGFEMAGVASSLAGMSVSGSRTNLAIRNGTVRSWGGDGVDAINANNGQYQDLRLSANGQNGLSCGPNSTVVNCAAQGNGSNGFNVAGDSSTVSGCTAQSNAGNGISTALGSTVSGCTAVANTLNGISVGSSCTVTSCTAYINQQHGIKVGDGCTVKDCTSRSNTQDGIFTAFDCTVSSCTTRRNDHNGISADAGNTVSECTAGFNGSYGIQVTTDCLVRHNDCRQNGRLVSNGAGISADGAQNRIDDNNMTANGVGIYCNPGNIVIRNTARANTLFNYSIVAGNAVGVIVAAPASGGIFGSTGGSGVGSTDPWANFSY
jgi:hypothetical protein